MSKVRYKKTIIIVALIIGIILTVKTGYDNFIQKQITIKTIDKQIFPNLISDNKIEATKQHNVFSKQAYTKLTINIPSLASKHDDTPKEAKLTNITVNREILDTEIENWLLYSFNSKEACKITSHIIVKYRDKEIINHNCSMW